MIIEYKGYVGSIELDTDEDLFHGEVVNTRDVITFQAKTASQLRKALKESVEDYLSFCTERGEAPNKPFSGNFPVRTSPNVHHLLYAISKAKNTSMSKIIEELVKEKFGEGSDATFDPATVKSILEKTV